MHSFPIGIYYIPLKNVKPLAIPVLQWQVGTGVWLIFWVPAIDCHGNSRCHARLYVPFSWRQGITITTVKEWLGSKHQTE